ncbi:IgG receptor FcRn large subunit p51 isoform X7 [Ictidomys tridecemlineatus]
MGVPWPQPWALGLLLFLLPQTRGAENHLSLLYHLTAVSSPAPGTPAFWVSGWLGPQQYLSYSSLRAEAEPCGAWVWENQVSWYWEKETTDLRNKEKLFLDALTALGRKGSYTLQGLLGCELGPDNVSVPTATFALNGEEFMRFDPKNGNWTGDWPEAQTISEKWMQQAEAVGKERTFLLNSCPQRLLGHLERGRVNLEWKESPAKSSVPVVGIIIGFLLLTAVAAGGALLWRRMRNGLPGVGHKEEEPRKEDRDLRREEDTDLGGQRLREGQKPERAPWISFRGDDVGALLPTPGLPEDADCQDINSFPATA